MVLTAENYADAASDLGDAGGAVGGDVLGTGSDTSGAVLGSTGVALATSPSGTSRSRRPGAIANARPVSFLDREAGWLGNAADRMWLFEPAFGIVALGLLLLAKLVLRTTSRPRGGSR